MCEPRQLGPGKALKANMILTDMQLSDIDAVLRIEQQAFPTPWSRNAFIGELTQNPLAIYVVGRTQSTVACYAGTWLIHGEAHITNVAVDPAVRGMGYGEAVCRGLLARVKELGATKATLEVRTSNMVAQQLYHKLGFRPVGVRPGYYTDTNEDALIMWKDDLQSDESI